MCKIPGPWRRRAACGETAWLIGWALGLLVLPRCSGVIVTSVRPDRGSLAGGTRLHIQVPEPRCSHSLCPVAGRSCACMHVPVARAHAMCVCARGMWCYACVSVRAVCARSGCGRLVGIRVLVRVHAPRACTCAQACVRSEVACACFGCVHTCKCAGTTCLCRDPGFQQTPVEQGIS